MLHPIRILLLVDRPLVRAALRELFASTVDLHLVGETANIAALPTICTQAQPHILLLNVSNATLLAEIVLLIQQAFPKIRVVALLNPDDDLALKGQALACSCYISEIDTALVHLLRAAAIGSTWVTGRVITRLSLSAHTPSDALALGALTPRERQVCFLLGCGWSNQQIAAHLHCTQQSVRNYSSHVYKKLKRNRKALVAHFQHTGKKA